MNSYTKEKEKVGEEEKPPPRCSFNRVGCCRYASRRFESRRFRRGDGRRRGAGGSSRPFSRPIEWFAWSPLGQSPFPPTKTLLRYAKGALSRQTEKTFVNSMGFLLCFFLSFFFLLQLDYDPSRELLGIDVDPQPRFDCILSSFAAFLNFLAC